MKEESGHTLIERISKRGEQNEREERQSEREEGGREKISPTSEQATQLCQTA